ncbi:ERAP1-like C-terminal domain-containing protein, partial [Streptomyces decoyicus]
DQDLTYAKVRLDPVSWDTALGALSGLPDPLTRAVVWNAARDMVRDGELAPAAYLDAARAHLPYETDLALVQGVLAFARTQIADRYLPHTERHAALVTLTALSRDILRRTEGPEHGSEAGLRLTAVRAFIDSATTPEGIQDWLDDGSVPGGPRLDPELRWRILGRLATLGAAPLGELRAAIDAELARDPSATGREGAARCHAALPDPAAKQAAWDALFTTDGPAALSNYLFIATATGFWAPEQLDLLRPYVTRYFTDVPALAAARGPALAEAAGRHAFPAPFVEDHTRHLGEACHPVFPDHGTGPHTALRTLIHTLAAGASDPADPHCAAHLHCPPLALATAADLAACALNPSMDSWDQAPAASALEALTSRALAALVYPQATDPDALITTGGTESNQLALLLAREATPAGTATDPHRPARPLQIVCGANAHHSIPRSAWLLGLPEPLTLPTPDGTLTPPPRPPRHAQHPPPARAREHTPPPGPPHTR